MSRQSEIDRIVKIMKITESSAADLVDNNIRSKEGFEIVYIDHALSSMSGEATIKATVYKEER